MDVLQIAMDSWESRAKKIVDVADAYMRALFYGRAGGGKTLAASTFPNPLWIDTDRGLATIANLDQEVIQFSRGERVFDQLIDLLMCAKLRTKEFAPGRRYENIQTLVFDSFTSLSDVLLYEGSKFGLKWDPDRDDPKAHTDYYSPYSMLKNKFSAILAAIRDVPMNVVVTAGVYAEEEGSGANARIIAYRPAIDGGTRSVIDHSFNEVYYMGTRDVVINGKMTTQYFAKTRPWGLYYAKSRAANLKMIPDEFIDLTYDKIRNAPKRGNV